MIRHGKILIFLVLVLALPAAVLAGGSADPRTMKFPPLSFEIPQTERVQLSNGMVVYLMENHELPLVNMTAYVKTGSIYEPEGKVGLAGITGAVMRSGGTRDIPSEKLDAELEFMASSIETSIGADSGSASFASLRRNLDRTLELFGQVLMNPAFREDRVIQAKNRTIDALRRQNDDPKGIAERELIRAIYAGHPLGHHPTIATVSAITRDDLVAFHQRFYRPGSMILAVSGDFDRKALLAKLEAVFAGWQPASAELPSVAMPTEVKPELLFAQKEVNQTVIRMGHLGIDKNNPDLYALRVMDYILGGGFNSRLTTEIRSNLGLAYNVDSYFDVGRRFPSIFKAETETRSEATGRVIGLMEEIIGGMTKGPVSDQELALAKDSIINSFMFGFTKPEIVVAQRARMEFYGYPAGYLERYRDNIAKVTKEEVLRVAKKYLRPDRMMIVVVGDAAKFDKPLSSFGPVRELKLDQEK
jgi:predicted Zn-dependent peptidase